jgi:hypothetical protein
MTSSVRAKMAEIQKEQNRASQEGNKPEDRKQQHSQAAVGGVSAKAGVSDSTLTEERVRARDEKGHFIADDPSTPESEAWIKKVVKRKPAAKKKTTKKG